MAFLLFLLVNAVLFIRPGEIMEELLGAPVYQFAILLCVAAAIPHLFDLLWGRPLDRQPILLCVLGLFVAVILAHASQGQGDKALEEAMNFGKVLVYFLLLLATVNTPRRLTAFLSCLVAFVSVVCVLVLLQFSGEIRLATYKPSVKENIVDASTGEEIQIERLQGTGIFQDPNDLCIMLSSLFPFCLHGLFYGRGVRSLVWLIPLGLFGTTIFLTHSRGGFVALTSGLIFWAIFQFGGKRALVVMLVAIPLLLVVFAGRQTNISANAGSAQTRIGLWSDWFQEFRANPLFGKGPDCSPDQEDEAAKNPYAKREHLAHNAYLQSFADLGLVGGMFFLGAFLVAFESLARYGFGRTRILNPDLARLHPFLVGGLASYLVGMLALSIGYVTSTYLWLGLAAVFQRVTPCFPPLPKLFVERKMIQRWALASIGFLLAVYVIIRVFRDY